MQKIDFLESKIIKLLQDKIPFCGYKKPQQNTISFIQQTNKNLHLLTDFNQEGFIFSPFNPLTEKSVIFPIQHTVKQYFSLPENKSFISKKQFTEPSLQEKEKHINLVAKTIAYLQENNLPKIVISRKEQLKNININATKTWINLAVNYPNAMVYLWYHPKIGMWIGATPEILLETKNKRFKTMALAGTKKTEKDKEILWQEKEKKEQQYVTDYITQKCKELDLKIRVSEAFTIQAGNISHICTDINGTFKLKNDFNNLINILHPTPAVCGIPKERAKDFILQNEGYNREYYTGFIGELNFLSQKNRNQRNIENQAYQIVNKSSAIFVNLRCMKINKNTIDLFIGGGITKDSNPKKEYIETAEKAKVLKNFII